MNNKHSFAFFIFISVLAHVFFLSDFALSRYAFGHRLNGTKNSRESMLKMKKDKSEYISIVFERDSAEKNAEKNTPVILKNLSAVSISKKQTAHVHGENSKNMFASAFSGKKLTGSGTGGSSADIVVMTADAESGNGDIPVQDNATGAGDAKLAALSDSELNGNDSAGDSQSGNGSTGGIAGLPSGYQDIGTGNGSGTGDVVKTDLPSVADSSKEKTHVASYLKKVRARILEEKSFPPSLSQKGYEGVVSMKISLNAGGVVTAVRVESGSGFKELDEYAKAFIFRLSPFQPFPEPIKRASLVFRVPLRFVVTSH